MKKKLMIYILSTLLFLMIIVTGLFTSIFNHQYQEGIRGNLKINNDFIKQLLMNEDLSNSEILNKRNFIDLPERITFIDKQGKVLFDSESDSSEMDNHNGRKEVINARKNGEGYSIRYSESTDKDMMYYATRFGDGYIIRSSVAVKHINIFSGDFIKYYFLVFIVIILMAVWFSNKLSYVIVKPIRDLDFITSRIARGELNRRVNILSDDEIGKLGKNFNFMTDRLEATLNDVIDKQNRLEAILKSMDSGVIAVDRNYNIIMVNPYVKKIFGIDIDKDIMGENLLDSIRNFELENILALNNEEYQEMKIQWPVERDLRIKTADIINRNEHIGTVAVVQDITDIRRLENMRSQFVANVSHELKTPLTSIKGFSETLREVDDPELRIKFLDIINDESERLTRLINDILTLSDIEQQREMKRDVVRVNCIAKDVYNLIKNSADKKNVSIIIKGEDVPDLIGDIDKFKQMIINLMDNAVKYSEDGDSVVVEIGVKNNNCVISIEDTGMGIPKEQIPRLFERFYRVDKARSRANGGTGLGLAIVKHILISFNGAIEVESEVGVGSKFTLTIPYNGTRRY